MDSPPFLDFFKLTKCYSTKANHNCKLHEKVATLNCYKINTLSLYKSLMCGITCKPKKKCSHRIVDSILQQFEDLNDYWSIILQIIMLNYDMHVVWDSSF